MFQRYHEAKERREAGFTLIELLVVILIIAILAAIAIPVFLNQRKKGWKGQSESALANAALAAEDYSTGNDGSYEGLTPDLLEASGFKPTDDVEITVPEASADGYCIQAVHALLADGDDFKTAHIRASADGDVSSAPQDGGC